MHACVLAEPGPQKLNQEMLGSSSSSIVENAVHGGVVSPWQHRAEVLEMPPRRDAEAPLLPDAVVLAVRRRVEVRRDHAAHVVPRPDLHHHLLVHHGHVHVRVRHQDPQLAPGVDAAPLPDRRQRRDLLLQAPVEHVVVELEIVKDARMISTSLKWSCRLNQVLVSGGRGRARCAYDAGDPRVREDVGVSLHDLVRRERPQPLRGPGVVVINKRDGLLRHPPDQPSRLAVTVAQAPQLSLHAHLQQALGGEIERHGRPAGRVHPVHQLLPALVLVRRRLAVPVVVQRVPNLRRREARPSVLHVRPRDGGGVALGEVEAPAVEPDVVGLEPAQPVGELPLHARVEVVDVGRSREALAGVAVAAPVGVLRVVAADHVGAPVQAPVGGAALEHAVDAAGVLVLRAPVVDHDVGHALDALGVERRDQGLELRRRAVLGRVQVVQPPRHVPCRPSINTLL
jgi:hypothetical protein